MTHQDEPCLNCKMPVIRAITEGGVPMAMELDPALDGIWKLRARSNMRALAIKPTARLSFGVKLYKVHVCARIWGKK